MPYEAKQVWLFSKWIDLFVLYLPVCITWIVCFLLPETVLAKPLPLWGWAIFILGIDVSHVWSTIYRTYLDPEEFDSKRDLLVAAPIFGFTVFFIIALISLQLFESSFLFWRILAYFALYHFIKQQYGFLAIYNAKLGYKSHQLFKDKFVIYLATLWPVAYWHLSGDRKFGWMINHDFFNLNWIWSFLDISWNSISGIFHVLYWVILLAWALEQIVLSQKKSLAVPIGKILWGLTTAFNWWLGIVYFNSDLAFSITNVVAHGIPYMCLIFFYVERKKIIIKHKYDSTQISKIGMSVVLMLMGVLLLGFIEEYHWDMLLNRNKSPLFESVLQYPIEMLQLPWLRAFALALLSTPQVTHYVLDGFIWKAGKGNPDLKKVFFD